MLLKQFMLQFVRKHFGTDWFETNQCYSVIKSPQYKWSRTYAESAIRTAIQRTPEIESQLRGSVLMYRAKPERTPAKKTVRRSHSPAPEGRVLTRSARTYLKRKYKWKA